jgi:hypothetical protein
MYAHMPVAKLPIAAAKQQSNVPQKTNTHPTQQSRIFHAKQ